MIDALIADLTGSFTVVPFSVAAARLILAAVLCGAIGLERETRHKPAGLRTHMLVGIAACLFTIVGQELASLEYGSDATIRVDPLRLIEAVTSGVAFLAAGIIFASGGKVRNITTGASMWLAGAVGLASGAGQGVLALTATLLIIAIVAVIGAVERRIGSKSQDLD
ncbi:putative Mg(2+) transport ATPase [Jannaschia seosinensis]|uniref:Protein MgtC n=1 Tax=Jannaschia seosinensis TaxID=313367 RepID=A0A0M7BG55_9RHOB|nr:MgtC/SapB family protein [Jannaschia seosinensis]CUH40316.1 putative Mg(2+) transport ATPase [Jannaschia seosinensis]